MSHPGKIVALILAAGLSSRMGSPKPLLPLGRSTALEEAIGRFREAGIEDVRVVLGHGADTIIPHVDRLEARWIINSSYREGMLSSILTGIGSFEADVAAFFLLPVDTPLVKPKSIQACLDAYRLSGARLIYPAFRGHRGHPPLIATSCVAALTSGHEGGLRAFLERYEAEALDESVVDQAILLSCNTIEEYRELLAYASKEDAPKLGTALAIKDAFERSVGITLGALLDKHARSIEMASRGQRAIYLVRHGALESVGSGRRYIGQLDLPLSAHGIQQAEMLRERLRQVPFSAVFCSDLRRAVQTAGIISEPHGLSPQPRQDLREIALGVWEGLAFEEVRRLWPEAYADRGADIVHFRVPGGESFMDLACRVIPALIDLLRSSQGDVLLVAHAGVNRVLLSQALGKSLDRLFEIPQDYGCLNLIRFTGSRFELEVANEPNEA